MNGIASSKSQPPPTGNGEDVQTALAYDIMMMGSNVDVKIPDILRVIITFLAELNVTLSGQEEMGVREVLDRVRVDLEVRTVEGEKKYGTRLLTNNGRNSLVDLYQELLDASKYAKQAQMEGKLK